ncbi:GCN5-related N-acetyltransferase [Shewanella baltica OS625]|uniref:GCN5-related N-acetyltransferase n=1 Tax=Shewanella baltica (strain OS195) TaxID=399599 RepID=A9L0I1_SHEB9|nr:GNAT family N-acetyltransferase [Shewanella baltica]ABX49261.1 GCN5-related N-acetyltransferase [Shewanella baltica OS195]ADT94251.1 GCN5-related N-acetyltransferase [Shewanella baltica OS678]EHC04272.1 GCN5-related N-acetyltransferase [Shewanella baltica OS625]
MASIDMESKNIRLAQLHDAESIQLLLEQLHVAALAQTLTEYQDNPQSRSDELLVCELPNAQGESQVVAVMALMFFDYFPTLSRICRITAIVVDADMRGQGIGTQLIDFAKARGKQENCQLLELTTSTQRIATQQYYESIGFTKTSFRYSLVLS